MLDVLFALRILARHVRGSVHSGLSDEGIVDHAEVDAEARSKRELVKVKERRDEVPGPNHERRLGLMKPHGPELTSDSSDDPASDVAFDSFLHSVPAVGA